jgi:hypothetical protein
MSAMPCSDSADKPTARKHRAMAVAYVRVRHTADRLDPTLLIARRDVDVYRRMGNESCPQNGKIIKLRALWLFGHNELENLGRQFACQPLRCIFFFLVPKVRDAFYRDEFAFFS